MICRMELIPGICDLFIGIFVGIIFVTILHFTIGRLIR